MKSLGFRIVLVVLGLGVVAFGASHAYSIIQQSLEAPTPEPYALDTVLADQPDGASGFVQINPDQIPNPTPVQPVYTPSQDATPLPPAVPPDRLVIPAIQLDAPVVKTGETRYTINNTVYIQWTVPDKFAAGWSPESGYPGRPNNIVLFGHHNVNGAVFANLYKLTEGDQITVYSQDKAYTYTVSAIKKVKERGATLDEMVKNSVWIQPTTSEQLTLVTCWPPWQTTYRLIVIALPQTSPQAAKPSGQSQGSPN